MIVADDVKERCSYERRRRVASNELEALTQMRVLRTAR